MRKVDQIIEREEHILIQHYKEKYSHPHYPPSWMIAECLTFGTWSKVFDNLRTRQDKKKIAVEFRQSFVCLASWSRCLTDLRNLCAHHERLWNRLFTRAPQGIKQTPVKQRRFWQQGFIVNQLLEEVFPNSEWKLQLYELMSTYDGIPYTEMGFQNNWRTDAFWELTPNQGSGFRRSDQIIG